MNKVTADIHGFELKKENAMKIRYDFVSNSSSSSFVLWGISYDTDELAEKLRAAGFVPKESGGEERSAAADIDAFLEDNKISYDEYVFGYDDNYIAFGLSPEEMKDNETLKEFKTRVIDRLKSYGLPIEGSGDVEFIKGVNADGYITVD